MRNRRKFQFGIVGLLLLTAVVAFTIRGMVAYFDRPDMYQSAHVLIKGKIDKASIGDAIVSDSEVEKLLRSKRVEVPADWLSEHVNISEISGRSDERVLAVRVKAKSWEFEPRELEIIVNSAVNFIRTNPSVTKTSVLLTEIGKSKW